MFKYRGRHWKRLREITQVNDSGSGETQDVLTHTNWSKQAIHTHRG